MTDTRPCRTIHWLRRRKISAMKPSKKGPKASFPDLNACSPNKPAKEVSKEDILEIYEQRTGKPRVNINDTVKDEIEKAARETFPGLEIGFEWPTSGTGTYLNLKIINITVKNAKVERQKS